MTVVAEQGSNFLHDLGNAASRNPLAAALIGMGVLWLFSGRGPIGGAKSIRSGLNRVTDAADDAVGSASSTMRSGAGSVGGAISSAAETVQSGAAAMLDDAARVSRQQVDTMSEYARSIPDGSEIIDNVRSNLTEVFRRQPLALGAVGLAIGAGIAAALPSTRTEAEYLGETSDSLKEKAQEFAAEQATRAGKVAERALGAATEEARSQGLTMEGARSAAADMAGKLERVVDAAEQGASQADATQ
jgi:uncharacterized phage infection (PIP) family protein YhgE